MPNDKILDCKRENKRDKGKESKANSDFNNNFVNKGLENQDNSCKKENRFSNNSSSGSDINKPEIQLYENCNIIENSPGSLNINKMTKIFTADYTGLYHTVLDLFRQKKITDFAFTSEDRNLWSFVQKSLDKYCNDVEERIEKDLGWDRDIELCYFFLNSP